MFTLNVLDPLDLHAPSPIESATRSVLWALPEQLRREVLGIVVTYIRLSPKSSQQDAAKVAEIAALLQTLGDPPSYTDYEESAKRLDVLQGHEAWKVQRESVESEYNPGVIEAHMKSLKAAMEQKDLEAMAYHLSTGLSRDLGSMNSLRLHKHSWHGSKALVSEYITTATNTIDTFVQTVLNAKPDPGTAHMYEKTLRRILKYYGQSALTLSGGAILGMKHIGVAKALVEADLLPEIISGASAGSIIAAVLGSKLREELDEALDRFPKSDLACFDEPGTTILGWAFNRLTTFWRTGRWFTIQRLESIMKEWLGDITFREARNKTRRKLNICVSSADSEPQLLNYLTAPNVYLWSAVCASCAVPGVFPSQSVVEKDPLTNQPKVWMENAVQLFVDGSLDQTFRSEN